MAPPPAPFPSDLSGLIAALEAAQDAIPAAIRAYSNVARQLQTRANAMSPLPRYVQGVPGNPVGAPASRFVWSFVGFLQDIPTLLAALRSLENRAAVPVSTEPLYLATGGPTGYPTEDIGYPEAIVTELSADKAVTDPAARELAAAGDVLPWWPAPPAPVADAGQGLWDCPPETWQHVTPVGLADTMRLLRGRLAGNTELARRLPPGPARNATRAAGRRYHALVLLLQPLVPQVAAQVAAYLNTSRAAIAVLIDNPHHTGEVMPVLTTTPATVTALATRIRAAIDSGHGGRLQVSDSEQAFSWAPGLPTTLLAYLATGTADSRKSTMVTAKNSATPAGPVAEGGAKPDGVEFVTADADLTKYAGTAKLTVEQSQFVKNIETAVAAVLDGQIIRALEVDAAAAIVADAGVTITAAADVTAGVLAAVAQIKTNGGSASVVGLTADDWIELMTATGAGGYLNFSNPENGPAGTWMGLAPVIVPSLPAGTSIVADGRACGVLEVPGGPLCIVDPFTEMKNNKINIAVEAWALAAVTNPGAVATVTTTVADVAASRAKKS